MYMTEDSWPPRRATVRGAYTNRPTSVPAAVLIVGSIIGLIVVLTLAGWAYHAWAVDREAEIRRGSLGNQDSARDAVLRMNTELADIDVQLADPDTTPEQKTTLQAQRDAISDRLCNEASEIRGTVERAVQEIMAREGCA